MLSTGRFFCIRNKLTVLYFVCYPQSLFHFMAIGWSSARMNAVGDCWRPRQPRLAQPSSLPSALLWRSSYSAKGKGYCLAGCASTYEDLSKQGGAERPERCEGTVYTARYLVRLGRASSAIVLALEEGQACFGHRWLTKYFFGQSRVGNGMGTITFFCARFSGL